MMSSVPWKAPSAFTTTLRLLNALADRRAFMVASEPELVNRTRSIDGVRSQIQPCQFDLGFRGPRKAGPKGQLLEKGLLHPRVSVA